jgi:LmbE family N-acetylglucosaminyl deacetylase
MALTPSARYLFLFAHPDDDAFIAGTMRDLMTRGSEIHAAWLTSGGFLGGMKTREAELASAMDVLGLEPSHLRFPRFPDLGLLPRLDEAADYVASLVAELRPESIFATAFEGGHPDHDAVNFAAVEGVRRSAQDPDIYEFPLYNASGPLWHWKWRINAFPPGPPDTLYNPLSNDAIECKHAIMRAYSTQWMYMLPARLASPHERMVTRGEPYRPCPLNKDHTIPPHSGTLGYERWINAFMRTSFKKFAKAVTDARRARL